MTRKTHVHVDQAALLDALAEAGPSRLDDIADAFNISTQTARRKLEAAVRAGQAMRWPGTGERRPFGCAEYAALTDAGTIEWGDGNPVSADPREPVETPL